MIVGARADVTLALADDRPSASQAIAVGRAAERITGRALADLSATLWYRTGMEPFLPLAVRFRMGAEGYFAFALMPDRDLPDVSGAPSVVLRAQFQRRGVALDPVEATVPGAALAIEEIERPVGGRIVRIRRIAGRPVDLSLSVDPRPVALAGIVIRDHDPAVPAAGVTVTAGLTSTVSDAGGRFFLPALPSLPDLVIQLADGATTSNHHVHLDHETPVNRVSLSLPS